MKVNLKRLLPLFTALLAVSFMPTGFGAEIDSTVSLTPGRNNAYIVFDNEIKSNKLTFEDGMKSGVVDSGNVLYSEHFEMDGVTARRVYAQNVVYMQLDKSYYQPGDHRFLVTITYYDFGPDVGYFYFDYNSNDESIEDETSRAHKRIIIEKSGITPKWCTVRIYIDDADFQGKQDYGSDMRLVTRTYNAFAKVEVVNVDELERSENSVELPVVNAPQEECLSQLGLYDKTDDEGSAYALETGMTRIETLQATLKAIGYWDDAATARPTDSFTDLTEEQAKVVAVAEKLKLVKIPDDRKFDPDRPGTAREVMTYYLRHFGLENEGEDVYGSAYELALENGLVQNTDFIIFPDNPIIRDNFVAIAYNALTALNQQVKKVTLGDLLDRGKVSADTLELTGVPELAAFRYYVPKKVPKTTIVDRTTGRTYYYMNFNGDAALRPYITSINWNYEGTKFVFGSAQTKAMYEYDTINETVRFLDNAQVDTQLNAVVATDDTIYYGAGSRGLWKMDWNTYEKEYLGPNYFTIISVTNDGEYISGYYSGGSEPGTLARYNMKTGKLDDYLHKDFTIDNPNSSGVGHPIINPEYPELLFFCNEGTTTLIPDRLWLANWDTEEIYNLFVQAEREDGLTGECSGHEVWGMNGEYMYWVKYSEAQNVGQSGLMRSDKYGTTREYINDDYPYWHCYPSGDDNWIVGDTSSGQVILVSANSYRSYLIAQFRMYNWNHPYQPHPIISRNAAVMGWQMVDDNNVVGCAWADIRDITGQEIQGGSQELAEGLSAVTFAGADSEIVRGTYANEECIIVPKNNTMYCAIDDDFLQTENGSVTVEVTYYDYGLQPVELKYTSAIKSRRDLANRENAKLQAPKTGVGRWRTDIFNLTGANLSNAGKHQSDFTLSSPLSQLVIKDIKLIKN